MAVSKVNRASVTPKIQWKNNISFRHDLFKLANAKMRKNISWKKQRPELADVDHSHFYHSHSSTGTVQKYCVPVGGHFHEMSVSVDPQGNMVATAGPALRKVDKKLSNGSYKTIIEEIKFQHEEVGVMQDDHTHVVEYLASEVLSPQKVKTIQQQNANFVQENTQSIESEASEATEVLG